MWSSTYESRRSFAALFDKLSRIKRQSRPKYKSAVPNWFIRRTLHVPNLIIRFGTCKVRRLNPLPLTLFVFISLLLHNFISSLLNFSFSLLNNFIIFPLQCFYSLLLYNFVIFPSHSWIFSFSTILIFPHPLLILESPSPQFYYFPSSFFFIFLFHNFIISPPPPPPSYLFYIFSIHKYIDLILTLHRPYIDPRLNFFSTQLRE